MKLLSVNADAKTVKGEKKGVLTGILYLAPAHTSGVMNVCAHATPGCMDSCLFTAGRAAYFPAINQARIRKTVWLKNDRQGFLEQLAKDIKALVRKAEREGFTPAVRVNGTSDLPWLSMRMALQFPKLTCYDYTKHPRPWERLLPNYHLTFSLSESNLKDALDCLQHGVNVAVVFDTKCNEALPKTWQGFKVIDGDLSDLRFKDPQGVIVGLRAKGRAKKDQLGFTQRGFSCGSNTLVHITGSVGA
jgi:hypothetical protein